MHFLMQIVTTKHSFTLYSEDNYPLMLITDLSDGSTDGLSDKDTIMDYLFADTEVSVDDIRDMASWLSDLNE